MKLQTYVKNLESDIEKLERLRIQIDNYLINPERRQLELMNVTRLQYKLENRLIVCRERLEAMGIYQ